MPFGQAYLCHHYHPKQWDRHYYGKQNAGTQKAAHHPALCQAINSKISEDMQELERKITNENPEQKTDWF